MRPAESRPTPVARSPRARGAPLALGDGPYPGLQRNIRRYLGLNENRVNADIHRTLTDPENCENFYFFNNGITIICKSFRYNALQGADFQLKLENMQVINGGQTCKTIQQALNSHESLPGYQNTYVMVRVYELADDDQGFVTDITYATNSQNPVDLREIGRAHV